MLDMRIKIEVTEHKDGSLVFLHKGTGKHPPCVDKRNIDKECEELNYKWKFVKF